MASGPKQTVSDLRRKAVVTRGEISAAIDAYLADPLGKPFKFESGHTLDVAAAVEAYRPARAALAERGMREAIRQTMIWTAVFLAVPIKT